MHSILVKTGEKGMDNKYDVKPEMVCIDLFDAVKLILKKCNY